MKRIENFVLNREQKKSLIDHEEKTERNSLFDQLKLFSSPLVKR